MIRTSAGSARRILSFPAVQPCETIPTLTLLNSLSQLAGDILSYRTRHVSTNRRNVRETFRQINNLVIVLDEIRIRVGSSDRPLPDSAVLILSELHVIFQKLKFLVEDCARDGARLWMLMNSDQVSGHFRVLTRSISNTLDAFPVRSTDLPREVNELIDLVVRQTRKARVQPDPDDKRVVDCVGRILTQFENRVDPDPDEITRVLEHVGIEKWSDCGKQIRFIEEEIGTERLDITMEEKNKTQIELLSGLMGFMFYCRCVIFRCINKDPRDDDDDDKVADFRDLIHGVNPDDLRCPISMEIMSDPVVIGTGHTYDRSSISRWFRSGNLTCPKTGRSLTNTELVDNLAVKHVIKLYNSQNGVVLTEMDRGRSKRKTRDVRRTSEQLSLAAEGVGKLLAGFLAGELVNGGEVEDIGRAVRDVSVLTKTSIFNRSCLVESGTVDPLLKLLRSEDHDVQKNAMAALLNISKNIAGKSKIAQNGGLGIIVEVLNDGMRSETRQNAATALFYLSAVGDYSRLIGENPDSIPGLLNLIKGCIHNDFAKRNALMAIMGLLMQQDNHWRVLAGGAVPVLLDLMRSEDSGELTAESMEILAKLAEYPDGTIAVIRRGGLKLAVKILGSPEVSPAVKKSCVALLLNLCTNGGGDVVGALVKSPLVMGSLYTVLGNGGCGDSKKTSALIRMIHEFQERKTGSTEPVIARERFVHAW
ncbi:PREDICTED: U-box domain-containing protein 18 [Tarenaya hassleriana]|uniref:U-box domain-containing protein 18 n=1 Tax=Tarenaya hassleriana TaxID=28532 RepID=UPI00053C0A00|nr:PREDICTED: U-box domain-containing protein 18 [Tarenaya hassleriana]